MWDHVDNGLFWAIQNGNSTHFWKDRWVPGGDKLLDALNQDPQSEWDLHVSAYAFEDGWNWEIIQ